MAVKYGILIRNTAALFGNATINIGGGHCHTPHLEDTEVRAAFLTAFNAILNDRTEILVAYGEVIEALTNTADLDVERGELQNETDVVMELMKKAISENAHKAQDQEEYQSKYEGYCARFEKARNRLAEIEDKRIFFTFRDGTEVTVKKGAWEAA